MANPMRGAGMLPEAPRPRALAAAAGLALDIAARSLWLARRRLLLAWVAVVIGFCSVHALAILSHSAHARLRASLESLGGDVLTLTVAPSGPDGRVSGPGADTVGLDGLARLVRHMAGVAAAEPFTDGCLRVSADADPVQLVALSEAAQPLLSFKPAAGRLLGAVDQGSGNVVLGADAARRLQAGQPYFGVGTQYAACAMQLTVVGILQPHPGADLVQGFNINNTVFMIGQGPARERPPGSVNLLVRPRAADDSATLARQLRERIEHLHPAHGVSVTAAWDFMRARDDQIRLSASVLGLVGAVALLVGAMGICNAMLASVADKRAEIGLRMALGARPADIVLQFVMEGLLICVSASCAGFLAALAGAHALGSSVGLAPVLPGALLLQATLLSVLCGVGASAYPAWQAARTDPAQCLRGPGMSAS